MSLLHSILLLCQFGTHSYKVPWSLCPQPDAAYGVLILGAALFTHVPMDELPSHPFGFSLLLLCNGFGQVRVSPLELVVVASLAHVTLV